MFVFFKKKYIFFLVCKGALIVPVPTPCNIIVHAVLKFSNGANVTVRNQLVRKSLRCNLAGHQSVPWNDTELVLHAATGASSGQRVLEPQVTV